MLVKEMLLFVLTRLADLLKLDGVVVDNVSNNRRFKVVHEDLHVCFRETTENFECELFLFGVDVQDRGEYEHEFKVASEEVDVVHFSKEVEHPEVHVLCGDDVVEDDYKLREHFVPLAEELLHAWSVSLQTLESSIAFIHWVIRGY